MRTPSVVINFKTYAEVDGERCYELIEAVNSVAEETGASIVVCPPMPYLAKVADLSKVPVFAQHIDPIKPGSHTGFVTPESVRAAGAVGTLINHSEHRLKLADIDVCVQRARELDLETIVCTNNLSVSKAAALLGPDYIAVEPPELIGGDVSVTSAKPEIVADTVNGIKALNPDIGVLCGAGVKTGRDVAKAVELGSVGVLLASGITKASDARAALTDLISGL